MVLQSSGQISLSNIGAEFGGTAPFYASNYYAGASAGFVPAGTSGIPTSGQLAFTGFWGKAKSAGNGLYNFSTHLFTNASATGRTGPTLSQCRSAYSSATWAQDTTNNYLNMTTNGIQLWKVPASGSYTITVVGASGRASSSQTTYGYGARMIGTFNLTQGEVLKVIVGQIGTISNSGSGGGGTGVVKSDNSILVIAGGGGGAGTTTGTPGHGLTTTQGGGGAASGNGGPKGYTSGDGGWSGGGGGFSTDGYGGDSSWDGGSTGTRGGPGGGFSFANGCLGSSGGGCCTTASEGGFGCGGGGGGTYGGGGGGGYSGGSGSQYTGSGAAGTYGSYGGGGGSINNGTSQINSSAVNNGAGYVTITANFTITAGAGPVWASGTILTSARHGTAVSTLLPNKTFTLLYRASRDGYSASAFHTYAGGYAGIWVVVKANNGYIATAYSSLAFTTDGSGGWRTATANTCWLNNLDNGTTVSSSQYYNTTNLQYSIYDGSGYGPTFGGGHDMYISDNCNSNTYSYSSPSTYTIPSSSTLFGSFSGWSITDIEVYRIT